MTQLTDARTDRGSCWVRSSIATHSYLLGHIFTLYPSPRIATRSGHISLVFITASHLLSPPLRRMIDAFGEDRGGTCARLLRQSWLEGGGGFPIHAQIVSRLPDTNQTITLGWL